MSVKAKVKSRQWFCRGHAPFICKRRAKAQSKIPATSPWTPRAPPALGDGFTSSAKPTGHFARFPRVMAAVAMWRVEFHERNSMRKEFQQCDGFQTDDRRALCDSRDRHAFKGYYRNSAGKYVAFSRSFVQFDGEGDTANARPRAIGGHPAAVLRVACLRKDPDSPYANKDGYVPFGKLRITPPAAAMAAPAGRSRTPRKSSR